ncbi:putative RecB family exonuclease [Actinoplanes lutulentus]|uniref:Putative RecB family exonuclease n=1 Tax=Actinoplanes lutulentus TaxID=1287878 RepID=A0A327ZK46_9ACTN|nr:PD-(D/E)XK nuclease family protein [Actinoplanes lutulentus]MBB2944017.1 putative RecB family exonuclease [Actinoplanes lutulentus]RAK42750.1 putative RecB family exonuclease [Actinoplanes lutulentus]
MTAHPSLTASQPSAVPAARGKRPESPAGPSLSPSRAADFKTCPLLFRFRTIDKLPELPTADQIRGTLVHAVLERLFDLPAAARTPEAAAALVAPEWQKLLVQEPSLAEIFTTPPPLPAAGTAASKPASAGAAASGPASAGAVSTGAASTGAASAGADPAAAAAEADATGQAVLVDVPAAEAEVARIAAFLSSATALLSGYFAVEDPQRLQPAERETLISTVIGDDLLLRGYIDRLDVSPAGDLRVVDYKTGGAPREAFEGRALFQLKFYALVLWRTRGVVPRVLRLLYLKDAEVLDYSPEAGELERFERTLTALSAAIERAKADRDFRPKPSRLCGWCRHQDLCPEFGGTPPPFPELPLTPISATTALTTADAADTEPDRVGPRLRDDPLG